MPQSGKKKGRKSGGPRRSSASAAKPDLKPVALGVDLGTTNSQAFLIKETNHRLSAIKVSDGVIPSVALFNVYGECLAVGKEAQSRFEDGERGMFLCADAKRMLARAKQHLPDGLEKAAFCPIVDNKDGYACFALDSNPGTASQAVLVKPETVLLAVVRELVRLANTKLVSCEYVSKVVVAIPHGYIPKARELTLWAATEAVGTGVGVELMPEPAAAATTFLKWLANPNVSPHHVVLVVDVGGGTTDVTIVRGTCSSDFDGPPTSVVVLATAGDPACGGRDADALLKPLVLEQCRFQEVDDDVPEQREDGRDNPRRSAVKRKFTAFVESFKLKICSAAGADDAKITKHWTGTKLGRPVSLAPRDYRSAVRPVYEKVAAAVTRAIKEARDKKAIDARGGVDHVVLVGGASGDPGVRAAVQKALSAASLSPNFELSLDVNEAIAQGAGWYAWARHLGDEIMEDVVPMDIGIGMKPNGSREKRIFKCIPANTPISEAVYENEVDWSTAEDNQDSVEFEIFVNTPNGRKNPYMDIRSSRCIKKGEISDLPPGPQGQRFSVKMDVDCNLVIALASRLLQPGCEPLVLRARVDDPGQTSPAQTRSARATEAGASGRSAGTSPGRARASRTRARDDGQGSTDKGRATKARRHG
ncbi:unnamed protein product [Pedinophyceae sp. YPF-701]|nr:unnamed protein product [Pedinophyceae sp. YPF-701]